MEKVDSGMQTMNYEGGYNETTTPDVAILSKEHVRNMDTQDK